MSGFQSLRVVMVTFYRWKAKYDGLTVSDLKRLKRLEDENRRLKRMRGVRSKHGGWTTTTPARTARWAI